MAGACFSCSVCAGVWAVRVWQSAPAGGLVVFAMALAAFAAGVMLGREARRFARLADEEIKWETVRAIRPRL